MPRTTTKPKEEAAEAVVPPRVKRKYTVTPDRPKNVPNTSSLALRQVSNANRITGTTTAVYDLQNVDMTDEDAEPFTVEPTDGTDERWLVACHDHEFSTTFHTLLIARRIAFLPPMWCPECAAEVPMEDLPAEQAAQVREYAPVH